MPEDLSGETNEKAFFIGTQINENVKIYEVILVDVDKFLANKQRVFLLKFLRKRMMFHVTCPFLFAYDFSFLFFEFICD